MNVLEVHDTLMMCCPGHRAISYIHNCRASQREASNSVVLSDCICMYVCMYVCMYNMYVYMSVTDVGVVSISDYACSLHAEVRILAVYASTWPRLLSQ